MKQFLILITLLLGCLSYSQNIEFIEKADSITDPKYKQFIYLSDKTDLSKSRFIAKVKSTGSLKSIIQLFDKIKSETQKYGANSFRVENFKKLDAENGELILSTFFVDDSIFEENFKNLPKNKIYVFGDQDLTHFKTQSYKVQGQKHEIENGHFKVFEVRIGEEIKINKGGFTGMTFWIRGKEKEPSTFLSFSGIGITGGSINTYGGGGVNVTTGRIHRIEPNLALALLQIYNEQK